MNDLRRASEPGVVGGVGVRGGSGVRLKEPSAPPGTEAEMPPIGRLGQGPPASRISCLMV